MMAQSKGHTAMFAVRDINQLVRPATMMVPKVTLKDSINIELFGGVVQAATADAVMDCVIEGIIPKDQANELCIISLVWIDPRCAKDPNLDKKDMYRTNYEATKLAIRRALNDEPSIDELIANRHTIRHPCRSGHSMVTATPARLKARSAGTDRQASRHSAGAATSSASPGANGIGVSDMRRS